MSDAKDPAIKLFGRTILAADEVNGSGSDLPSDLAMEEPDKVRGNPSIIPFSFLWRTSCLSDSEVVLD